VKSNWLETWILAPLLVPPAIILDPFTFYWNELVEAGDAAASHGETDGLAQPSCEEGR
jgi:hypothetical protein